MFTSRGWFVMLSASLLLILCIWLAISPYGKIKLGKDDDEPEFSTVSWLAMLFAAGMGVGLLFWGTAEPLSHFNVFRGYTDKTFRGCCNIRFLQPIFTGAFTPGPSMPSLVLSWPIFAFAKAFQAW